MQLTFVTIPGYGILYRTLVVTYVGQYVRNESLMYEPRVKNRHIAAEKTDTLWKRFGGKKGGGRLRNLKMSTLRNRWP